MAQLIDKSALVTEIERRGNICKKVVLDLRTKENQDYYQGKAEAYKEVLDLLDTLEVKEVDLKEEVERFAKECGYKSAATIDFQFAKHFFELGMVASYKTQKGE